MDMQRNSKSNNIWEKLWWVNYSYEGYMHTVAMSGQKYFFVQIFIFFLFLSFFFFIITLLGKEHNNLKVLTNILRRLQTQ